MADGNITGADILEAKTEPDIKSPKSNFVFIISSPEK